MKMEFIGEKLRKLRINKGLTTTQLSEISGVRQGSISLYENNKQQPMLETVEKLAAALGVDPIYFYREDLVPVSDEALLHIPRDLKEILQQEDIVPYLKLTKDAISNGIPAEDLKAIYDTCINLLKKKHHPNE